MIKRNHKYSKRINYDALKNIFGEIEDANGKLSMSSPGPDISLDKTDDLYTFDDDKSDGEGGGMLIIEEEGGDVGGAAVKRSRSQSRSRTNTPAVGDPSSARPIQDITADQTFDTVELGDEDAVGEDDVDEDDADEPGADGVDYGWDEGYEQEV